MAKNLAVLYGKKSVYERLKANPASIRKVFIEENFNDAPILELLEKHHIRAERAESWKIERIKHAKNVQGIVAKTEQFEYTPFEKLLQLYKTEKYSLIFLDHINDPHNAGVIIRTLACFGKFGIIIPSQGACEVNDTVMHVAIGGENYVPIACIENLATAISEAKKIGMIMAGSVTDTNASTLYNLKIDSPLGIVFGSEIGGIHPDIMNLLDHQIHIPTPGADLSLNITVACGIVCAEITRRTHPS